MYVTAIHVSGFRDLPRFSADDLPRRVGVRGPSPASTALGDALELFFAALDAPGLHRLLDRWGLLAPGEEPAIEGEPFPEQARWTDGEAARALVDPDGDRTLRVRLSVALDPPLYRELRAWAARDPAVLAALAREPVLHWSVSALFATSLDALALDLRVHPGPAGTPPPPGTEAPAWMPGLARRLVGRLCRHHRDADPAPAVLAAATSRTAWTAYRNWRAALADLDPRPARGAGDRPMLLAGDVPLERLGPPARDRAALAASAWLSGADVMWVDAPPTDPAGRALLDTLVDGEGAPLEQLWVVDPEGALDPSAPPPPEAPPRRTVLPGPGMDGPR